MTQPTRGDKILDTICTDLWPFFQPPECVDPLDADKDKFGTASDHRMVIYSQLDNVNSFVPREKKIVTFRPWTDEGFSKMEDELNKLNWDTILNSEDGNRNLLSFHDEVMNIYQECFPSKTRSFTSENQPWYSDFLSKLKRKMSREFHKHRISEKYLQLKRKYKFELKKSRKSFYTKKVKNLRSSDSRQWWKQLKKLTNKGNNEDTPEVEEIKHLHDQDQAETIARHFAKTSQEYQPLQRDQIKFPPFEEKDIPYITETEVLNVLQGMNPHKGGRKEDIPSRILKHFAKHFSKPIASMINDAIR